MLQGRRVISRRDWLVVNAPGVPNSGRITTHAIVYATEAYNNIPGIGKVITAPNQNVTPSSTDCDTVDPIPFPARSVTARLYDETRDVIVVLSPSGTAANTNSGTCESTSGNPNLRLQLYDGMTGTQLGAHKNYIGEPNYIYLAVDDFDLDGFDDILVMNDLDMRVFYASDHSDTEKQLSIGPATYLNPSSRNNDRTPINEPTTGDFNGDGVVDVAWIGGNFQDRSGSLSQNGSLSVFFASVCPGNINDPNDPGFTVCDGAARFEIRDPGIYIYNDASKTTLTLDNAPLNKTVCGASDLDSREQNNHNSTSRPGAVMLGNFDNNNGNNTNDAPKDELLVLYLSDVGNKDDDCSVDLVYYQWNDADWYDPNTKLTQTGLFPENTTGGQGSSLFQLHGQATYLDWYGSTEQAVLGISGTRFGGGGTDNRHFPVTVEVTFDDDNTKILQYCRAHDLSHSDHANPVLLYGSTTGVFTDVDPAIDETIELVDEDGTDLDETDTACSNFDSTTPGQCSYNLQIALLKSQHHGDSSAAPAIILYNVQSSRPSGGSSSLKCSNDKTIHTNFLPWKFNTYDISNYTKPAHKMDRGGSFLHAGDLDGTSQRVGAPTIARITSHHQPQSSVWVPPMHIDYVECVTGCAGVPKVTNISVAPRTYYSEFVVEDSTKSNSTSKSTTSTSTSWSDSESVTGKIGTPAVAVSATNTQTWGAMHDNTVSQTLSTSDSSSYQSSGQTNLSDLVFFSDTGFNIYHYPLIGVTGCPATILEDGVTHTCTAVAGGCNCTATCPTSITLDDQTFLSSCVEDMSSDPSTGCLCKSAVASTSLCTGIPPGTGDPNDDNEGYNCATDGGGNTCCLATKGSGGNATDQCTTQFPTDASMPVCNSDATTGDSCCTVAEQQINMTLSGPEKTSYISADGADLEWYQPKHQPGQLFSYPGSYDLLQKRMTGLHELSETASFSIDSATLEIVVTYSKGSGTDTTTGNSNTHSFDTTTSVTMGTPGLDKASSGASASDTFDYNSSESTSTLQTSATTQSDTAGVTISSDAFFIDDIDKYNYQVFPFIFGTGQPDGTPDQPEQTCPDPDAYDAGNADDVPPVPCDNQTTGAIVTGFAVDLSGDFWTGSAYKTAFDVALNHPRRWGYTSDDTLVDDATLQCRGKQTEPECYFINVPLSDTTDTIAFKAWSSYFYAMRGLMVTVNSTDGPQRSTAVLGDTIHLQAVVYNYSLTDMTDMMYNGGASDVLVKASFYRQEVDVSGLGSVVGDSVLIETVTLLDADNNPMVIAPWNTETENFAIFRTSVDTSETNPDGTPIMSSDSYYVFWVVAWAEDNATGNLLPELAGHGLDSTFDTTAAYANMIQIPLENVGTQVDPVTYTNNIGHLKQTFFLEDPNTSATATAAAVAPDLHELLIEDLQVQPNRVSVDEQVIVSAGIFSIGAPSPGVRVLFFDGRPEDGAKPFDVELLSHIRANDSHFLRVPYQPGVCGHREIVVEAVHAGTIEARDSVFLTVPCAGGALLICHKDRREMSVAGAALEAHLDHGDTIGSCR